MYSHFDKKTGYYRRFVILLYAILFPVIFFGQSNTVSVIVQVYPPFSTQFADYVDDPNKVSVQLLNNSQQTLNVYLRGSFTGDNGIDIHTEDGYKPATFLTLLPNTPLYLSQSNIGDVFSPDHLVFNGITENDMIQMQGLPEGNYQLCISVFDYFTDNQLSLDEPSGCSNTIIIQYVDPPQILTPLCGDSIVSTNPQNILFSWTIPVQTGINIKYHFLMVEMHPGTRNPSDAIASAVPPYFYQVDVNMNQFLYGPGDPQLIEGRSYAFVVQAIDESNQVIFKNNGISEACQFKYKAFEPPTVEPDSQIIIPSVIPNDFLNDFELIPNTIVKGRLHYKLATDVGITSPSGSNIHETGSSSGNGNVNYDNLLDSTSYSGNANINLISPGGFYGFTGYGGLLNNLSFNPPFGKGTINENTIDINNAEPLRNTEIRLVARYSFKRDDGFFKTRVFGHYNTSFFDLSGKSVSENKAETTINKVLAVTTTDEQGNFTFDFKTDFFTGVAYNSNKSYNPGQDDYTAIVSLKIEVVNQKFCSPDLDIFISPGDNIQIAPQVALIKDFNINLKVRSAFDKYEGDSVSGAIYVGKDIHPKAIPGGDPVPGALVSVFRDMQKLNTEHPAILLYEGDQSGETVTNSYGEFKVVFDGVADEYGKVVINHLVEHWEPVDGQDKSPYYLYIRTRNESDGNSYENTLYNFYPWFTTVTGLAIGGMTGIKLNDNAGNNGTSPVTYNHFYKPPSSMDDYVCDIEAAPPEIRGRVMIKSNIENIGAAGISVSLLGSYTPDMPAFREDTTYTNSAGFFSFKDLWVTVGQHGEAIGPYRRIKISSPMYKTIYWRPEQESPFNMKYGELYFKEFQLEPKYIMKGAVEDETGNAVAAYVRILPNGPFVKTDPRYEYDQNGNIYVDEEVFEIPVNQNGSNIIEIQPLSSQFFPDTIEFSELPPQGYTKTFKVYKKLHRLKLIVMNGETNSAVANADVIVGDTMTWGTTNEHGLVELTFPSPGQQFVVKVNADNYTPLQTSFNIPVSNDWTYKSVFMEPAASIHGTVTEETSGQPVDSALIYIKLQSSNGQQVYLEAYSAQDGSYTLKGIPMELTSLDVHITKQSKNPSYIGTVKTITIEPFAYPEPSYDFKIKAVNRDLSEIWGFPVTFESYKKEGNTFICDGYFFNMPNVPSFNLLNENEKVYFKNLRFHIDENNKISPDNDVITTETYSIPIKINGGFSGDMFIPGDWFFSKPLTVHKAGNNGIMSGALRLDLASFKFAYDFTGDFYLGQDTTDIKTAVFKSVSGMHFFLKRFYLFDMIETAGYKPYPVSDFRVFGFNASSTFDQSYYQDGVIHIGAILHTDIRNPNGVPLDLKINAGEIRVTREDIDLVHNSQDNISFELEKWRVESTEGWNFDKTRDAIVVPKAMIYTGLGVDAAITGLNIRPDALREGKPVLQGGLSLGGILTLQTDNNMKPVFNYDAGVGHYRVSLVGTPQGPVAWADNLPATNDRLEFTSLGMLSDNSTILSLSKHMIFRDLIDIYVDQVMSGPGFFQLAGMPDLGIPGYIPTRAIMTYKNDNGILTAKLEPLSGIVDCNGNTVFKLKQESSAQSLTKKKYTSYGTFFVKPPNGTSGGEVPIKGFLVKTPSDCYIDAIPQTIHWGKEIMNLTEGKISAVAGKWGELAFNCKTNSQGLDDENEVSFVVHGGIEANSNNIKVDNIDTPLGNLVMAYLFSEKALVGELTIKNNLDMGFAAIKSGAMATRFDPSGFYMMFSGDIVMANDVYCGGFIMGAYDNDLTSTANRILKSFESAKPDFSSLHGFYAIGQRNIIDKSFPVLPTPIWVEAKAGIGAYVQLDYNNPTFILGGYAFAKASGGITVPMCGYVGAKASAFFGIEGGYKNDVLTISSCGTLGVGVGACGLEGAITILNKNSFNSNGSANVTFKLGGSCN